MTMAAPGRLEFDISTAPVRFQPLENAVQFLKPGRFGPLAIRGAASGLPEVATRLLAWIVEG